AYLTVAGMLAIVAQPASLAITAGTTANFSVSAIGNSLAYQWTKNNLALVNGGNISGATTRSLTVPRRTTSSAASDTVVVTNSYGSVMSVPAALSIVPPSPLVLYEPFDYANVGNSVSANTPANWTFGGTGANDLNVAPGSLWWPGLAASVGNSVTNGGT